MDNLTMLKVSNEAFVIRCNLKNPESDISFQDNTLFIVMEGAVTWKDKQNLVTVRENEIALIKRGMNLHYSRKNSDLTGKFDALMIRLPDKFIFDFRQRFRIRRSYTNDKTAYVLRSYSACDASMMVFKSLYPHLQTQLSVVSNIHNSNIELALLNIQHCNEVLFNKIMNFYIVAQLDIVRYVEDNWEKAENLEQLAVNSGNSLSTIERKFKAETGECIREWIKKRNIDKSKELLMNGKSIEEASFELGYTTPNAFIRAFKSVEGTPPAKWRKMR